MEVYSNTKPSPGIINFDEPQAEQSSCSNKPELITPYIAKEYLKHNVGNRPLSRKDVSAYVDIIKRGQWKVNGDAIRFSKSGRLLDGQHRLTAIVESGIACKTYVIRGLDEDAYQTIDQGKARTARDIFTTAGIIDAGDKSAGIKKLLALRKGNAIGGKMASKTTYKLTNKDILDEYNKAPEFYSYVSTFIRRCIKQTKKGLLTKSEGFAVMAFLILDKKHEKEEVEQFMSAVLTGTYTECNAIRLFRNILIQDMAAKYQAKARMDARKRQNLLFKTWNLFHTGKDIKCRLKWRPEDGDIIPL